MSSRVELAQCGHSTHRDQAQELLRVTRGFIGRVATNDTLADEENQA